MIRATVIFPESHRKLGSQKGISARLIVNIKQVEKEVLLDVSSAVRKYINLLIISKDRRAKSIFVLFCAVIFGTAKSFLEKSTRTGKAVSSLTKTL